MAILDLNDLNKVEVKITTYYESMYNDFCRKVSAEEEKSPLTDREQMFVDIIKELLETLDKSHRRW